MKEKMVLIEGQHGNRIAVMAESTPTWIKLDYVVLSELVEVDFIDLPKETVVNNQIAVIDKKITDIMAKSEATITQLKARKQELLAITHDTGE